MAHASYLREKARSMRIERKLTIDELAERLALSRSTIYYWVRDLPIPGSGSGTSWPAHAQRQGTLAMQRKFRRLREEAYREGVAMYQELVVDPTFRDFVCLYIAEGYKRNRNEVSICNSDPTVMSIATRWLGRLTKRRLRFSLQYHADQDPDELRKFWGTALGTEPDAIKAAAQVEQQPDGRAPVALAPWRDRRPGAGHATASTLAGMDGLFAGRMAVECDSSGRSEAWYRAPFGAVRSWVQIPPPRFVAGWMQETAYMRPFT
jgi:excisionase family DNA binding protein